MMYKRKDTQTIFTSGNLDSYIWNKIYFITIVPSFEIGSVTNSPNIYFV